jgi:hypothetical protein
MEIIMDFELAASAQMSVKVLQKFYKYRIVQILTWPLSALLWVSVRWLRREGRPLLED